jgi:hypothetical protein
MTLSRDERNVTVPVGRLMAAPTGAHDYRSIAFEAAAPLEKYCGWAALHDEPGLRAIAQRRGPVRRCLVMAQGALVRRIDELIRRLRLYDRRTDLLLHDFDDPGRDERIVAGRSWRRAGDDERILHNATFVIDLARDDEALIQSMHSANRRDVRKAIKAGLRVEVLDHPEADVLRDFMTRFETMAEERRLRPLKQAVTQRMFDNGDLTLYRADDGSTVRAAVTVYRSGDKAHCMTSVDGGKRQDGAARLLYYEVMRDLRERGIRWLDFGGVASTDESDGIFRFKRGFGGRFVPLGAEYIHRPPLVSALVDVKRRISGWRVSPHRRATTATDPAVGALPCDSRTSCRP